MKFVRLDLVEVLKKISPVLVRNPAISGHECFQFCNDVIWATDGEIVIGKPFGSDTSIRCAVPGFSFLYLLESLKDKEVEIVQDEKSLKVVSTNGKIKATFSTQEAVDPPDYVFTKTDTWMESSNELLESIKSICMCRFAVSEDRTAGPLCGVRIQDGEAIACNRYRIVKASDLDMVFEEIECTLSERFLDLLSRNWKEITGFDIVKETNFVVEFKDHTTIGTPFLQGEYREVDQYFPNSDSFLEIILEPSFSNVLDRHIGFLKKVSSFDKSIEVSFRKNLCVVFSHDPELGDLCEEVSLDLAIDKPIKFVVNPLLLKDLIKICPKFKYFKEEDLMSFEENDFHCIMKVTPVDQD